MQESLLTVISTVNAYMFDYVLIFLLVSVGLWYSFQTKFVQVRCFVEGVRNILSGMTFKGEKQAVGITSFRAFLNAVGAQVGTGNVVGAAGAILIGGPGAIFWMWIIAFLGMASMYAETVCALSTRKIEADGTVRGGPVYYILEAVKGRAGKFWAAFFAISTIISAGLSNLMVQSNSLASTLNASFSIPNWITGFVLIAGCGFILKGNIERISAFTEKIVPIMSYLFIGGAVAVLVARIQYLPEALYMIFYYAFEPQAIIGGGFGEALKIAISQGVKRGLFSNEAGKGSIAHAHVQANVYSPHSQGVVAMLGVFFDTFVILTLNALVIISTMYTSDGILANGYKGEVTATINAANLAQTAFASVLDANTFDGFGSQFVALCLCLFALSTILITYTFGKMNVVYLFGDKADRGYFILILLFIFAGTLGDSALVWEVNDLSNGFMVFPNVFALIVLTDKVKNACRGLKKVSLVKRKELR